MNLLLDTHSLLWWLWNHPRLGTRTRALIRSNDTMVSVSSASIWEISIKAALKRLDLRESFDADFEAELNRGGFRQLPITFAHARAVRQLPLHHSDPFDRMLIAQAQMENLTLVTVDPAVMEYDVRTIDAST